MRKDDLIRIRHMLDAALEAIEFMTNRSREELDSDRKLALAVVKLIEIIGEAAYQITEATRQRYPDIPWIDIVGMRHRLVHGYYDIDLDIVWSTVHNNLPPLVEQLKAILGEE